MIDQRSLLSPIQTNLMTEIAEHGLLPQDAAVAILDADPTDSSRSKCIRTEKAIEDIADILRRPFINYPRDIIAQCALWGFHQTDESGAASLMSSLTTRQGEVVSFLTEGHSVSETGRHFGIIKKSVTDIASGVVPKWRRTSLYSVVHKAAQSRIVPPPVLSPGVLNQLLKQESLDIRGNIIGTATSGLGYISDEVLYRYYLSSPRGLPQLFSSFGPGYIRYIPDSLQSKVTKPVMVDTPFSHEVVTLVGRGFTDEQIGWRIGYHPDIVRTAIGSIIEVNGLDSSMQLAMKAVLGRVVLASVA